VSPLVPAAALGLCLAACVTTVAKSSDVHVVYQLDAGSEQAQHALRYIRNHLRADPRAGITVVAMAQGIDFLLRGAEDSGGYPFELSVADLAQLGVRFEVCGNTLTARGIKPDQLIEGLTIVPSGAAEISSLEYRQGYAYIRP
jgi:intracellular sulfur oxidation DsrE/DsrF family protein